MLHAAGLLMSWLTGKRAHILSISLSLFSHSRLSHLLALLCAVSLFYCVWYMKINILCCTFFVLFFFAPHFGSRTPTVLCPAVTLLLSLPLLFYFCFSLPLFSLHLILPSLPPISSSLPLHFVQCRRVLLVPRALLTLSLLPLTVWWDLTVR